MNIIFTGLFLLIIIGIVSINFRLNKEIKKNRILQSFISGIIRSISDYRSKTDQFCEEGEIPDRVTQLPIPYLTILKNVDVELSKDQYLKNYEKWLKLEKNIFFDDERYSGDGFNFMYLDLFDKKLNKWNSKELNSSD
jgi:hypothetical protein